MSKKRNWKRAAKRYKRLLKVANQIHRECYEMLCEANSGISNLEAQLKNANDCLTDRQGDVDHWAAEADEAQQGWNAANEQAGEAILERDEAVERIAAQKALVALANDRIATLKAELKHRATVSEELREEWRKAEQQRDNARRWAAVWKRAAKWERAAGDALIGQLIDARRDCEDADKRIATLEGLLRERENQYGEIEALMLNERTSATERIAKLSETVTTLKAFNLDFATRSSREAAALKALRQEHDTANERIATLTAERDRHATVAEEHREEWRKAEQRVARLEHLLRRWGAMFVRVLWGPIHELQQDTLAALGAAPIDTREVDVMEWEGGEQ